MRRCLELALQGAGFVAPNPMVGAVLVHEGRIIGEGYHREYGGPHAEVHCINQAIHHGHEQLLRESTLYVSLEPCAHYGKTPPCTDLIIRHRIPAVVIGCRDPFVQVDGKGIEKLRAAGIAVEVGVSASACEWLNRRFLVFHTEHRPYITLKWAETADGKIGSGSRDRLRISNEFSNRLVHKWRSEETSILVGTNTVINDDPELTTRLWPGRSPLRLILDRHLRLPSYLKVFDGKTRTIVFNTLRHDENGGVQYYQITSDVSAVQQIVNALYQRGIQSVLVEGGAQLLQSFIDEGPWDEARVIRNKEMKIPGGLPAPWLSGARSFRVETLLSDQITWYCDPASKYVPETISE